MGAGEESARQFGIGEARQRTYQEDVLELSHVVDTSGVELKFDLVGDLVHSVFPVCHLDWLKVCFVVLDSVCF